MVKSYCVKEKKQTNSVPGSEHYVKTKNNRLMLKSICAECGVTKTKFVKQKQGKLVSPSEGVGIGSTLLTTAFDHGMKATPIIGKKRYKLVVIMLLKQ